MKRFVLPQAALTVWPIQPMPLMYLGKEKTVSQKERERNNTVDDEFIAYSEDGALAFLATEILWSRATSG